MPSSARPVQTSGSGYMPSSATLIKPKKQTIEGFLGNVGSSAVNTVGGIGSSLLNVVNPNSEKNTVANLGRLIIGGVEKLIPGTQYHEKYADAVGKFYVDRYGSLDKAFNSFYNDPVGVALDVATILSGGGAIAGKIGTVGKIGQLERAGAVLTRAGKVVDPLRAVTSIAGKGVRTVFSKASGGLKIFEETYPTRGIGTPKQLGKVEGLAGRKTGKLMSDYGIEDRTPEAIRAGGELAGTRYDDALLASKTNIPTRDFFKQLDSKIKELDSESLLSDTAKSQRDALIQRRAQLEQFLGGDAGVPLEFSPQLAKDMKTNIYRDVNPGTFNPSYQGSGSQLAAKDAYQGLISSINDVAPGTRQLGRDRAALIQLEEMAKGAANRGAVRNPLSIGKMIAGGAGGMVAGIPGAIGSMVAETVVNSPKATRIIAKTAGMTGRVLENARVPNLLKQAGNVGYRAGTMGRLLNPGQTNEQTPQLSLPVVLPTTMPSLPLIIPQPPTPPVPLYNPKQSVIKPPKNVFKNSAVFGKLKKLRAM